MRETVAPFERILEIKQALHDQVETGAGRNDPAGTMKMLGQMRGVLSRELDKFAGSAVGPDGQGIDGKAAVDLVSLIARTLEKIDQLERQIAESDLGASGEVRPEERAALRQTVADMISTLADRRIKKMQPSPDDELPTEDQSADELPSQRISQ